MYYWDGELVIRSLTRADAEALVAGERAQGWSATMDKYETRLLDEREGRAVTLLAELKGEAVGYVNVYPNSQWGPFGGRGWPEIVVFGVLEKHRRRGVGSRLMDVAEEIAARYADVVYLGVGLHSGYGSAQRMYWKRGYLPDGRGAYYRDVPCRPYESYPLDDELTLYLSKKLQGRAP